KYTGPKDYKFLIDGLKVNGKRKRLFFRTEKEALSKLVALQRQLRREGEQGASISASVRVEAVRALERLEPFGKSLSDAVDFYLAHLKAVTSSALVESVYADYYRSKEVAGL